MWHHNLLARHGASLRAKRQRGAGTEPRVQDQVRHVVMRRWCRSYRLRGVTKDPFRASAAARRTITSGSFFAAPSRSLWVEGHNLLVQCKGGADVGGLHILHLPALICLGRLGSLVRCLGALDSLPVCPVRAWGAPPCVAFRAASLPCGAPGRPPSLAPLPCRPCVFSFAVRACRLRRGLRRLLLPRRSFASVPRLSYCLRLSPLRSPVLLVALPLSFALSLLSFFSPLLSFLSTVSS